MTGKPLSTSGADHSHDSSSPSPSNTDPTPAVSESDSPLKKELHSRINLAAIPVLEALGFLTRTKDGALQHRNQIVAHMDRLYREIDDCYELLKQIDKVQRAR